LVVRRYVAPTSRWAAVLEASPSFKKFIEIIKYIARLVGAKYHTHFREAAQALADAGPPFQHLIAAQKFAKNIIDLVDFEAFVNLKFVDLVPQVKDTLSQILQRDIMCSLLGDELAAWDGSKSPSESLPTEIASWAESIALKNKCNLRLQVFPGGEVWIPQNSTRKRSRDSKETPDQNNGQNNNHSHKAKKPKIENAMSITILTESNLVGTYKKLF